MVYLTHYTEYPIYEPAEGGYYYVGQQADYFYRLNSLKQAQRQLKKMKKNLEADGFNVCIGENMCSCEAYKYSKYIGHGELWVVEKVYGSCNEGWRPYE